MDIIIYATKDGLRTLYSTSEELAYLIAEEKRSGANNDNSLGQSIYAIAFTGNGSVYTKYTIVKDAQRSNALGFIAFSLFINYNKSLKGEDIKSLLDKLSNDYSNLYIKNYYLNRGEKNLIREEWTFVNTILSEFTEQDKNQKEEVSESGTKEAAFIYYNDETKLKEYFDKPFQEEYSEFKQVFFINIDLKGSEKNPLNVLANSGIELKDIDLKNEYFYLNNYSRSKEITITANGKERSDGKNNNCIRAKWQVEIKHSKDERCYWPIQAIGTLSNPDSDIFKYLELKGNQIHIKYDAFNNPEKKTKTISFEIKNRKGEFIDDAEIQIDFRQLEKIKGHLYEITFIGQDLISRFNVSVKKDDFSRTINDFIPESSSLKKEIILEERNIVPIKIINEETGFEIDDFEVWTKLTNNYQKINKLEFVDEQIIDSYDIKIRKNGYENYTIYDFKPHDKSVIKIPLKKITEIKDQHTTFYKIDAGEYGKKNSGCPGYSKYSNGSDLDKKAIKANKGWVFVGWELNEREDTIIAKYEKEKYTFKKTIFFAGMAVLFLVISFGIWLIFKTDDANDFKPKLSFYEIQNYVEGDSLLLDKLNTIKSDFENQKPSVSEINNGLTDWFMGRKKEKDSSNLKAWIENLKIIEEAISKRELLNKKDFKELLKPKYSYSDTQQPFLKAIKKIDTSQYEVIKTNLGEVDNKTLSEIIRDLNKLNNPEKLTQQNEVITKDDNNSEKDKKTSKAQSTKQTESTNQNEHSNRGNTSPDKIKNINITNEIIKYIKGGELSKAKLNGYKELAKEADLKKSIDLILKIWELDGNQNNSYYSIQKSLENNQYLKDSEINKILIKLMQKPKEENVTYAGLKNANDIIKTLNNKL